ncbi:DUF2867 domain-containing protein [Mycobacterium hodleri]|uniref:DUF2867 domain-containing protein n=1 Tax=Mycolicibacterium hodleri TaxID=49897 RepID=UPI0027E325C8|nr:DUF2867 domain-containing protein [Mycolicibacterium hodleri]MCV7135043.1 DUF2867 domain-containing protein [Mycolicibacterium hodleri]
MVPTTARLPLEAHTTRPWRIHQIASDFDVLDVWALPTPGGPDDFPRLLATMRALDAVGSSPVVRMLFAARRALGRLFGWDAAGLAGSRFQPLFVTEGEAAFEIANRTVHGVLHLGWVPDGAGAHRGQMAVLVAPNGAWGTRYLAAIAPFRHLIVYPALLRAVERGWREHDAAVTVKQVEPSLAARDLGTLPSVEYADSFVVDVAAPPEWAAERWARTVLEGAPAGLRTALRRGWTALGLTETTGAQTILGWEIRHADPDTVLIGRASRIGMPGELLVTRRPTGMSFSTLVHHRTVLTRALWAVVRPAHVRTVSALLSRAGRAAATESAAREPAEPGPGAGAAQAPDHPV